MLNEDYNSRSRKIFLRRRRSPERIVGIGIVVCLIGCALILYIWG